MGATRGVEGKHVNANANVSANEAHSGKTQPHPFADTNAGKAGCAALRPHGEGHMHANASVSANEATAYGLNEASTFSSWRADLSHVNVRAWARAASSSAGSQASARRTAASQPPGPA
jgi:hypothetical protein